MIKGQYFTLTTTLAIIACQGTGEAKKKDVPVQQQMNNQIKSDTLHKTELLVRPAAFDQKDASKMGHYILNNNLDQELIISSYYVIEKLVGNKWQRVPLNEMLAFEDITYAIPPKKSKEFVLALSRILKDKAVVKGRYRLVKDAWLYGNDGDKKQLTAEFEIR